jgi:hypothetical protein
VLLFFEKLLKEFNYELLNLIIIDLNKLFLDIITLKKTKNINKKPWQN